MACAELEPTEKDESHEATRGVQMVSVPLDDLSKLAKRARALEAELVRYAARHGLTEEALRLFTETKS